MQREKQMVKVSKRERESDIILMRSALRREIGMQEMSDGAAMTEVTKEKKSTRKRRRENKDGEGFTVVQGAV